MTDPHWEFSLDVMPAKDESGMPVGSCSKRYSDFQQLENFVCAELGEAAWANMPKLPAAHTIPGVGKLFDTAEVAQQRRADLNTYLQVLDLGLLRQLNCNCRTYYLWLGRASLILSSSS